MQRSFARYVTVEMYFLKVKDAQIQAISTGREIRANRTLLQYANDRFPELKDDSSIDEEFVAACRKVANFYQVFKENDIATFLDLSIMYGAAFHKDDWAHVILSNTSMHGPDKIFLLKHLIEETGVKL